MRKTLVTMMITLAFVALAYYGKERWWGSAPHPPSQAIVARYNAVEHSQEQRDLPPNPFTSTPGRDNSGMTHNIAPAPGETAVVTNSAQSSVNDQTDVTAETRDDPLHRPNTEVTSVDQSVVGRPFPVSASVMRTCREADAKWAQEKREGTSAWSCAPLDRLLTRFAEDPRDDAWADEFEQTLRDIVVKDGRPFEIRAVECRTTICAIEAASRQGDLAPQTPYQVDLRDEERMYGYERTPSGQNIKVTLSVYSRW